MALAKQYGKIALGRLKKMTKLSLYLATLLLGNNFSASTMPKEPPKIAVSVQQASVIERTMVERINAERWDRNLKVLAVNPLLVEVARAHSKEMCDKNYFDHVSPTPELKTPMARYLNALGRTPTWAYLGENLFYCSVVDPERGHKALMESKSHRDNILNPRYEQVGVGVYISPDGRFWVTELFLAQID